MEDSTVDLWATDEVHFQQHGSRCQMWIPPETKDPILLHAPPRRSVGYFGAVRLRDGDFLFCREAGKFNGATFFAFMKSLRRNSIRTGRRVVVITDNAKYHHALLHRSWRENYTSQTSLWTICHPTPRISIPSNEFGSSHGVSACTTATSTNWKRSSTLSKPSSANGPPTTKPCANYAQLRKSPSLAARREGF